MTPTESAGSDPRFRHFVEAQQGSYAQALAEMQRGEKRSHWMWFIFPQLAGLGSSSMAHRYAIGSLQEAADYLQHPILGQRLREITAAVHGLEHRTASQIFGYPDDLKFHSSLTLFALASNLLKATESALPAPAITAPSIFALALTHYFGGTLDAGTLRLLPPGPATAA